MLIRYYIGDTEHASKTSDIVPREGEFVRFKAGLFEVEAVIHVETEPREFVAISIIKESD